VDVRTEGVQGADPLLQTPRKLIPFGGGEDAGDGVEGKVLALIANAKDQVQRASARGDPIGQLIEVCARQSVERVAIGLARDALSRKALVPCAQRGCIAIHSTRWRRPIEWRGEPRGLRPRSSLRPQHPYTIRRRRG
jgi:hypothetical protein